MRKTTNICTQNFIEIFIAVSIALPVFTSFIHRLISLYHFYDIIEDIK